MSATGRSDGAPPKVRTNDVYSFVGDSAISDTEVRLWLWYRRHHLDDRGAYISDDATATALGWGIRTVQRVRAQLVNHGLLEIIRRGPRPPAYYPLSKLCDSPPMATQDSPLMATLSLNDSPHDSPSVTPSIKMNRRNRKDMQPAVAENSGNGQKKTWLTPFWNAWVEQYGGEPSGGQLAKALKPLVDVDGTDEVLRRWNAYLTKTAAPYANPQKFAQTFGSWGDLALAAPPAGFEGTWKDGLYYGR